MEPNTRIQPIDVIVLGLMLLVAGSLCVPGLDAVRRHSYRERCQENLASLGRAMAKFHDANRAFPSGISVSNTSMGQFGRPVSEFVARSHQCDDPDSPLSNALTQLLPFLGEERTFDAYNVELAGCAAANATVVATKIKAFNCPANDVTGCRSWGYYHAPRGITAAGPATTDYALSIGGSGIVADDHPLRFFSGCGLRGWPGINRRAVGAFNVNFQASLDRFKDGAANTFLMGEAYSGAMVGFKDEYRLAQGNEPLGERRSSIPVLTPWSQGYIGGEPIYRGRRWIGNRGGVGSVFAATAWNAWYDMNGNLTEPRRWFALRPNEGPPNTARATFYRDPSPAVDVIGRDGNCIPGGVGSMQGFRSLHTTVPMLFADGSVKQIRPTIDLKVWVGLSSLIGREEIPKEF